MIHTEQTSQQAFPLADAALRLGLTSDALRMRLKRGKIQGFKRGRRVYVYLPGAAKQSSDRLAASSEQRPSQEASESEQAADSKRTKTMPPPQADFSTAQTWPVVVEFQKVELSRVLKENERLNRRLDQLFEEIGHLREIQQREQVLRQQDQLLHQQLQTALDRLTGGRLTGDQLAGRSLLPPVTAPDMTAPDMTPPETHPQETRLQAPPPLVAEMEEEPDPSRMASERRAATEKAIKENDTEELADILRQVGQSLHDQDELGPRPTASVPPVSIAKQDLDTREPTTPRETIVREKAERRGPGLSPPPSLAPAPPSLSRRLAETNAEEMLDDEQSSLAEILGRMGPLAEDRRNAARIMKRLFRNRGGSRRRDP